MKIKIYRIAFIITFILFILLNIYFIYLISLNISENIIHLITLFVILAFSIFEISATFKRLKKKMEDLTIRDLVYEQDKINRPPFIVNNVLLAISFTLIITFSVLIFFISNYYYEFIVLISIFILLFINNLFYDIYILVDRSKRNDIYKLIK